MANVIFKNINDSMHEIERAFPSWFSASKLAYDLAMSNSNGAISWCNFFIS